MFKRLLTATANPYLGITVCQQPWGWLCRALCQPPRVDQETGSQRGERPPAEWWRPAWEVPVWEAGVTAGHCGPLLPGGSGSPHGASLPHHSQQQGQVCTGGTWGRGQASVPRVVSASQPLTSQASAGVEGVGGALCLPSDSSQAGGGGGAAPTTTGALGT